MRNTVKKINGTLIIISILFSSFSYAQMGGPPPPPNPPNPPSPPNSKKEKRMEHREEFKENIETMKIGFLTKKLDLTPEQAQQFWPIYNQYDDKLMEIKKKRRHEFKDAKQNFDEMNDKDIELSIENEMAARQKELDLQKEYNSKFKSVLPIKKVAKLYAAEEQFKMVLLNKLKDRPPIKE